LHLSLASWLEQALTPASSWSQDRCGERAGADQTRALGTSAAISDVQPSGGTAGLARRSASIRLRSFRPAVALPPRDDTRTHQQAGCSSLLPSIHTPSCSCAAHLPGRMATHSQGQAAALPGCLLPCKPGLGRRSSCSDVRRAVVFDAGEPCATFRLILRRAAALRTRSRRPHSSCH
jgi:hypothetical protein